MSTTMKIEAFETKVMVQAAANKFYQGIIIAPNFSVLWAILSSNN